MISQNKKIILFASGVNATSAMTLSEVANEDVDIASVQYDCVDLVLDVKQLSGGTSPSFVASIQEKFNDNLGADIWVETAKSGSITATGRALITNRATGRSAPDVGSNPMLGEGGSKQIVITPSGSPTGTNIDIYMVFTN